MFFFAWIASCANQVDLAEKDGTLGSSTSIGGSLVAASGAGTGQGGIPATGNTANTGGSTSSSGNGPSGGTATTTAGTSPQSAGTTGDGGMNSAAADGGSATSGGSASDASGGDSSGTAGGSANTSDGGSNNAFGGGTSAGGDPGSGGNGTAGSPGSAGAMADGGQTAAGGSDTGSAGDGPVNTGHCASGWRDDPCDTCTDRPQGDQRACADVLDCFIEHDCSPSTCTNNDDDCGTNTLGLGTAAYPYAEQVYDCMCR